MHLSKHTFRFSVNGGKQILLYNPLAGNIDLVEKPALDLLDEASDDEEHGSVPRSTSDYLLARGYAYRNPEEEEAALRRGFEDFKDRERRSNMRFVILPTYQCNSRCPYCFIGDAIGQESLIDDNTMDLAFQAMDVLAEERGKGCTHQLSLFGGEPLVDTPAQQRVVERILQKGVQRHFLMDVVSNGFDLIHYVDLLKEYDVAKVQITFDGMREYHNKRRPAVDGRGKSFDRIVAGVDAALCRALSLNVRILVDRNSISTLPDLVAFFKEKRWFDDPNFSVHLGSVFDCFRCQPKSETVRHLTVEEGNKALHDICTKDRLIADLLGIDWQGVRRFLYTGKLFPPTYKTCFGGTRYFAFDLYGGIYACETTAGRPEYEIGRFVPELALNRELMKALEERNIFNIPACKECPQSLLCAGGCAFNAVVKHGSLLAPGCRLLKETLQYGFDYYWPEIEGRIKLQIAGDAGTCRCGESSRTGVGAASEVQAYYAEAALTPRTSLCCPRPYGAELTGHIPKEVLTRSYGCGSPVLAAELSLGAVVLDLGCGAGIDAFLAARFVGSGGRVIGVDATKEMVCEARRHSTAVAQRLGYDVVEFHAGSFEEVPLGDGLVDVVLSNCALNLCADKRRAFREIFRVLKPGGRFVISDVVSERALPESIRQERELWNQCLAGALSAREFTTAATDVGFTNVCTFFDSLWKEMGGVRFYTAVLRGSKRDDEKLSTRSMNKKAVYKGPFNSVVDDQGHVFPRGLPVQIDPETEDALSRAPYAGLFLVMEAGSLNGSECRCGSACCP